MVMKNKSEVKLHTHKLKSCLSAVYGHSSVHCPVTININIKSCLISDHPSIKLYNTVCTYIQILCLCEYI